MLKMVGNKSEYMSIGEWAKAKPKDYQSAVRQGFTKTICEYYGWNQIRPSGYWTKERCVEEALKYNSSSEWKIGSGSSYQSASSNNWLNDCSNHFNNINKPSGYWTKVRCINEAKKYKIRKDWECNSSGSHTSARKNGWYDECTKHMVSINKPSGYWNNKIRCVNEAKKYTKKSHWKKSCGSSLNSAIKNGWFEECTKHMI